MKKALFTIVCILYSIICFSQQIELNNVVIKPLNKFVKLSKDQILSFESKKFHDDKHEHSIVFGSLPIYQFDDILILFSTEKGTIDPDHLSKLKKGLDVLSYHNKSYQSSIETINNQQVLITSSLSGEIKYCRFFCVNKKNTIAIAGTIQFNLSDENKAKRVLDDVLKHITFKE